MARYKVILAYDGTAFSGMQRQANSRSVQMEVENALRKSGWKGRSILIAGRTDAGVHARGQVVAFDMEWKHEPAKLLKALNSVLPDDVAVREISIVPEDFHPRYDATARRYEYRLFCQPQRDPLRERYAWRVWPAVKLAKLRAAAKLFEGEHDFASFGSHPKRSGSTLRKVTRARWHKVGDDEFVFDITANAFLYHMVRRMVGIQVKVAQGLKPLTGIKLVQRSKSEKVRELAPAHGLTLVEVGYGSHRSKRRIR
ncbi:MAG: tRNA pseudouridine(38-40) synthase TruA [Anaerolineales bacterium]